MQVKPATKVQQRVFSVTVFFFSTFQLLALTQALVLRQFGIRVSAFLTATIMAPGSKREANQP
jgi:hypothetical protein